MITDRYSRESLQEHLTQREAFYAGIAARAVDEMDRVMAPIFRDTARQIRTRMPELSDEALHDALVEACLTP